MPDTLRLTLPSDLSIVEIGALLPDWLHWLDQHPHRTDLPPGLAEADAHDVQAVDSAGVQMLVALAAALEARGWRLQLNGAGAPLAGACSLLGLAGWLASRQGPAAAGQGRS